MSKKYQPATKTNPKPKKQPKTNLKKIAMKLATQLDPSLRVLL